MPPRPRSDERLRSLVTRVRPRTGQRRFGRRSRAGALARHAAGPLGHAARLAALRRGADARGLRAVRPRARIRRLGGGSRARGRRARPGPGRCAGVARGGAGAGAGCARLGPREPPDTPRTIPAAWFDDASVRSATGWNAYEGAAFVTREAYGELLDALAARDACWARRAGVLHAGRTRSPPPRPTGYRVSKPVTTGRRRPAMSRRADGAERPARRPKAEPTPRPSPQRRSSPRDRRLVPGGGPAARRHRRHHAGRGRGPVPGQAHRRRPAGRGGGRLRRRARRARRAPALAERPRQRGPGVVGSAHAAARQRPLACRDPARRRRPVPLLHRRLDRPLRVLGARPAQAPGRRPGRQRGPSHRGRVDRRRGAARGDQRRCSGR